MLHFREIFYASGENDCITGKKPCIFGEIYCVTGGTDCVSDKNINFPE